MTIHKLVSMYKLTFEDVRRSWRRGSNCALGSSTAQISAANTLLRQVYIVTDSHPVHHPGSDRIAFFSHKQSCYCQPFFQEAVRRGGGFTIGNPWQCGRNRVLASRGICMGESSNSGLNSARSVVRSDAMALILVAWRLSPVAVAGRGLGAES